MHNQIRVQSLKNHNPELLKEELSKINFPDYNIFSNVNIAYLDIVEKISNVVDKTSLSKILESKTTTKIGLMTK